MARILAAGNDRGAAGELVRVEIRRGLPSNERDLIGYAANRRQSTAWIRENQELVIPRLRPLRYDPNDNYAQPQEKGVDVQLALAVVESVLLGQCDIAILISNDTDLVPVVESVCRLKGSGRIETASWESRDYKTRLRPVRGVHHHRLTGPVFQRVETPVNYAYKGH
ncbi:MAG TPA: NYN domain-containing protein [Solirubrobacteraceae bacterium]|nr:NYN domain-containing protein [Solirubrobacteraceae bacterium]